VCCFFVARNVEVREQKLETQENLVELYTDQKSLLFIPCTEKPQLPPGVTQKDADLYKEVRERAAKAVADTKLNLAISPEKLNPSAIGLAEQERCPAAIEFGKYEIETWYSSPFPQEYAR
jgi:hypothetical protein